jgi:hypothetical protein
MLPGLREEFAPFGGIGHFRGWFQAMPWALYEISNPPPQDAFHAYHQS